ncbi:MAG: hypothetical protein M3P45_10280 [Acidobacteriota bacterium]|nr:hypothetical protein [Acidobacteriota bacterium]
MVRPVITNLFNNIRKCILARQREDYEKAITRVVAAIDSGKLKSTDKAAKATPVVDAEQPGWLSPLDGIDWIELQLLAEERKLPLETVNDPLAILRIAISAETTAQ